MDREPAQSFEDLIVWQKAHAFVLKVYRSSRGLPKEETYGLTAQFRRSAVSVPANIAEGFKKRGKPDKARLLNMAQGSLEEALNGDAEEVGRLLTAYIRPLLPELS